MNKKLLAIAVGAVVALPGIAMAQPTVYGKLNMTLEQQDFGIGNPNSQNTWLLQSNKSRIGVKGSDDLDVNGLKAIYQLEYETYPDDGSGSHGTFGQRNIFGGIQGSFGQLVAGMFDTPLKSSQGKIDEFNDLQGDLGKIFAGENRSKNLVRYATPKFGDAVKVTVAVQPGEGAMNDKGNAQTGLADGVSASIVYNKGGIYAAVAHDKTLVGAKGGVEIGQTTTAACGGVDCTQFNVTRVVGQYKADMFEVGAMYQMAEESEGKAKEAGFLVSGAYKIDRIKLKAQFGKNDGDKTSTGATSNASAKTTSVGADYMLGKGTKTFVYYTKVSYDPGTTGSTSQDDKTFGLGLEHKF